MAEGSPPNPRSGAISPPLVRQSTLHPGGPFPQRTALNPYAGQATATKEGERLYNWYNCAGCHFAGGGGIGPPLMDEKWIYGSAPENLFRTIVEGRPHGMPSFGGKIPEHQVWMIVTYIESMGGVKPQQTGQPERGQKQ